MAITREGEGKGKEYPRCECCPVVVGPLWARGRDGTRRINYRGEGEREREQKEELKGLRHALHLFDVLLFHNVAPRALAAGWI